nr:uncharacterized protein LOC129532448 [Gorilla gorilla gorilla]
MNLYGASVCTIPQRCRQTSWIVFETSMSQSSPADKRAWGGATDGGKPAWPRPAAPAPAQPAWPRPAAPAPAQPAWARPAAAEVHHHGPGPRLAALGRVHLVPEAEDAGGIGPDAVVRPAEVLEVLNRTLWLLLSGAGWKDVLVVILGLVLHTLPLLPRVQEPAFLLLQLLEVMEPSAHSPGPFPEPKMATPTPSRVGGRVPRCRAT